MLLLTNEEKSRGTVLITCQNLPTASTLFHESHKALRCGVQTRGLCIGLYKFWRRGLSFEPMMLNMCESSPLSYNICWFFFFKNFILMFLVSPEDQVYPFLYALKLESFGFTFLCRKMRESIVYTLTSAIKSFFSKIYCIILYIIIQNFKVLLTHLTLDRATNGTVIILSFNFDFYVLFIYLFLFCFLWIAFMQFRVI